MKKFKTKHALLMSLTSLMLCVSMLIGSTFAWFTDSVTSGVNRIVSGNLDVELLHTNHDVTTATTVKNDTLLFNAAADEGTILWEPGAASYETFTVQNKGTLNLKYEFHLNNVGNNTMANDTTKSLLNALKVNVVEGGYTDAAKSAITTESKTLGDLVSGADFASFFVGRLTPAEAEKTFTVVLYWPESADDNNWNPETTGANTYATSDTKQLWVDLGITLVATQETGEYDSFGYEYDANAEQPDDAWKDYSTVGMLNTSATSNVTSEQATTLTSSDNSVKATISAGAVDAEETTSLTLTVTPTTSTAENATAITTTEGTEYYEITLKNQDNAVVESFENNGYADVELYIGESLTDLIVYHKSTALTTTANDAGEYYSYNANNGVLTLHVTSFSPFSIGFNNAVAKIGDNYYATLAKAVKAAENNDSVVMLTDVKLPTTITVNKNITLDLNGKKISNSFTTTGANTDSRIFNIKSSLTINGIGSIETSGRYAIMVYANGKLVVNNGEISALAYTIYNQGTASVTGGSITASGNYSETVTYAGLTQAIVVGGTNAFYNAGTATISGGKISVEKNDAVINASGNMTISDGEIKAGLGAAITNTKGSLTVTGGTIQAVENVIASSGSGAVTVEGGTFYGDPVSWIAMNGFAVPTIKGGSFNSSPNSDAVAVGYTVQESTVDGTTWYTVVSNPNN